MNQKLFLKVFLLLLIFVSSTIVISSPKQNIIDTDKLFVTLWVEGDVAYKKGNYSLAEEKFKEALTINPKNSELYYYLAISQYSLEKLVDAGTNLDKAIKLGYNAPQKARDVMLPFKYREFSVAASSSKKIKFKGSTVANQQLIYDMLLNISMMVNGIDNIALIKPKFIAFGDMPITKHNLYGKNTIEHWLIETKKGGNKTLEVIFVPSVNGETDFMLREIREPGNKVQKR